MPLVVVGGALGDPRAHRQDRRGPIQRLDLGLLIHAQHHGPLGRVEVQPDDIADLLDEQRVLRQLPGLLAVGLQPERPPDPRHRRLVEPDLRAIDRVDQCVASFGAVSNVLVITSSTCASVIFRGCPGRGSSTSPSSRNSRNRLRHCVTVLRCTPSRSATSVLLSPSAGRQHDPRAQRQRRARRPPARPRLQHLPLLPAQLNRHSSRTRHHRILQLHRN